MCDRLRKNTRVRLAMRRLYLLWTALDVSRVPVQSARMARRRIPARSCVRLDGFQTANDKGSCQDAWRMFLEVWRRGPGSNRRIKVLQTSPLPLGYRALGCLRHGLRIVPNRSQPSANLPGQCGMERETRLELATLALARRCSTTELLPLDAALSIPGRRNRVKPESFPIQDEPEAGS